MSIMDDMLKMKELADEIIGKGEKLYKDNPEYAEERRINAYASGPRKLPDGTVKENGRVLEPLSRDLDDIPDDLGDNGTLG